MEQEKRKSAARRRVLFPGLIVYGEGAYTSDCLFRSLSSSGARLVLNQHLQLPEQFYLINIREGVAYTARLVWNRGGEMGVKYTSAIPLSGKVKPSFHHLRKLWLAKTPH